MASDELLAVSAIRVLYGGAEACHDVSLTVSRGEVVALLGANGAGKTTTLRAISGLHPPTAGSVSYLGKDITGAAPHRIAALGVAHVPEGRRLFGRMTVRENLEIGMYRRWPVKHGDLQPAFDMFPELERLKDRAAFSLSGGEQQMVAFARALLPGPDVIMLDEPSLGLAPVIVDRILETIARLREQGKGVLLVEQETSVAMECSDRGYLMTNGRVVFSGSKKELFEGDNLTKAYLGG